MKKENELIILGGGESGCGAAVLAKTKGLHVFLSDHNKIDNKYKSVLTHYDIEFEEEGHRLAALKPSIEVIKSPGIPDRAPIIRQLVKDGKRIIDEIEFASRYTDAKKICITGSNGKTTTALLTHHILKAAGKHVGLAGNIGHSFAYQVALMDYDCYVLELSSFQLDHMYDFKADIAVLLNITPDHLDRYDYRLQHYVDAKFRILQNQTQTDAFIYCHDDPIIQRSLSGIPVKAQQYPFSIKTTLEQDGSWIENENLIIKHLNNRFDMTLEQLALQGKHNTYNSMAAGISAKLMEIRNESIKQSMSDFQNIAHRLEYVSTVHGIKFINDSKATNVNATWYALEYFDKPVVWIAGGVDKGNEYDDIRDLVKDKVKAIICLGLDNKKLHDYFDGLVETIIDVKSAEEAVQYAYHLAKKGEIVLLSPACASFDLFDNYEDRGNQFKNAVNAL